MKESNLKLAQKDIDEALKAVEEIHQASLKILNEIGIKFGLDEVNEIFKKNGFRQEDGRTFFTEEQVMHALDIATKEFTMYGRDEQYSINVNTTDVNYTPGYGSPMITNRDGSVRNETFDDFLTMANLFHMEKSYDINGGILGIQGDEKDQENIFKILEIAFGGKEKLKEKYRYIVLSTPTSPLKMDRNALYTLMKGCEYNQPIAVCSACMPGSTAPVTIAGAVAMCNAEMLAGIVLTQLINPGNPVMYLFASYGSNVQ